MTLDELCREYTVHYYGGDERYRPAAYEVSVAHRAGVAAILTSLRKEISRSNDHDLDYSVSRYLDEILASDGVDKAAGGLASEPVADTRQPKTPAAADFCQWAEPGKIPAAAPVCVWTPTAFDPLGYAWFNSACGLVEFHERDVDNEDHPKCPKCRQTIKFKEAAR